MTHIGLNAQLLSAVEGYRAAGIHNYIHQLLLHLPRAGADDFRFTAMVGSKQQATYVGVTMQQALLDTHSPLQRILWEQLWQPFHLPRFDLHHAMAFVSPIVNIRPTVVTVYDLTFIHYPERLTTARRLYLQSLTGISCRRARRVIAISQSTADDLVNLLGIPAEKIDVTPLGYDAQVYRPLAPDIIADFKAGKQLPERFWLFLGTIEPRKNLALLLEAYAQLDPAERLPLILAGGRGWQTDGIDAVIDRHQLSDTVTFTGFVPTDEIALWYNSAEAFIYPSVFEGFGLPVLEAMASGTPVLTSNVSSLPEVAEGVGMTLAPDAVHSWVDALKQVYHDAVWRAEARDRGLQKATQFNWEYTARLTIDSYRRALSVKRS